MLITAYFVEMYILFKNSLYHIINIIFIVITVEKFNVITELIGLVFHSLRSD